MPPPGAERSPWAWRDGAIATGSAGDLVVLDAPSPAHIPYRPGTNLVWKTIKSGRVVAGIGHQLGSRSMRDGLLFLHIVGVAGWLGGGVYAFYTYSALATMEPAGGSAGAPAA